MDFLRQHEIFEIEVLEGMNSAKLLDPLIFGGGSMLRLCHELNRYSVDLDFWFVKAIPQDDFFDKCGKAFEKYYEITDAQMKHYTILFELRSAQYPKRLKIEMRREWKECDYQQNIAFTRFSTRQVLLKTHTLDQTMENKIKAFLDRGEIRDCFDIEFMIRRGVDMPLNDERQLTTFQKMLSRLKDRDFKVKLGSII
ncbi:MAG: nucleotidyl transferase AbiEii/AbiGii toxin family protein, partial [Deltaproteobacteria bacterium]|nr:nucleotidyl transferase AbiEii/AbiGii toxin family protein [Deltaproteobacteria bacterium]